MTLFANFSDAAVVPTRTPAKRTLGSKPRILLVDDEPQVLTALQRHLRPFFSVEAASAGKDAIRLAAEATEPFAAVMSDMRMPGMDGVAVLTAMREQHPDTVRLLLTGYAEVDSAIAAVNEGNIFRFLTKPASPETVKAALEAAVKQYQLVVAEREVLEGTLQGSVRALLEALSLANPAAFSRATRVKGIVSDVLDHFEVEDRWEIEVAAMLSQIGAVTLPTKVIEKLHRGAPLDEDEEVMVARLPELADQLLEGIPRLEGVRKIITSQANWKAADAPIGTKLLQLAIDFDVLEARSTPLDVAVAMIKDDYRDYTWPVIDALVAVRGSELAELKRQIEEIPVNELKAGMMLAADIRAADGMLLVARGFAVTDHLLERIENFSRTTGLENKTSLIWSDK